MRFLLYLGLLVGTFFMGSCSDFDLDTLTGKERLAGVVDGKKDVVLLCMGSGEKVNKVASLLLDNIPVSWEIKDKKIINYDDGMSTSELEDMIKSENMFFTVILDVRDVVSGKYPVSLFRLLKYYKRDFYLIADENTLEQKKAMLSLVGVYMEPGYYAINYDRVQHYRIFPDNDPHALENMIGKAANSLQKQTFSVASAAGSRAGFIPDAGYNAQMADKEALKQIEVYNRLYAYDKGDMDYAFDSYPYATKDGKPGDVCIDNTWVISAYNFQIYSKNNNCLLSVTNALGSGFSASIKDYTTPKGIDVYAYLWNLMQMASSEVTVHSDGGIFREVSYQPQTVVHGANYTENSFWKVSVAVSPTQLAERPWGAFKASFSKESSTAVSYKTESMSVTCKGNSGNGLYSKRWLFVPGEFYDRGEAFVYEGSGNKHVIDAVQAMTSNYVLEGGWTLRQNYLDHINNSMKLYRQQCIYTLVSDAQPGLVSVTLKDGMKLQKTKVHYNCGIRYGHESVDADVSMSKTVWIDYSTWDN